MNSDTNQSEHKDIVELLPWYVNQTLDAAEHRRVQQHLRSCEYCRGEYEFAVAAQSTVAMSPVSVPPAAKGLQAVLERIAADEKSGTVQQSATGGDPLSTKTKPSDHLLHRIRHWISAALQPQWAIAGIAAVLLGILFVSQYPLNDNVANSPYTVLSGPSAGDNLRILVQLDTVVPVTDAQALLHEALQEYTDPLQWTVQDNSQLLLSIPGGATESSMDAVAGLIETLKQHPRVLHYELIP